MENALVLVATTPAQADVGASVTRSINLSFLQCLFAALYLFTEARAQFRASQQLLRLSPYLPRRYLEFVIADYFAGCKIFPRDKLKFLLLCLTRNKTLKKVHLLTNCNHPGLPNGFFDL